MMNGNKRVIRREARIHGERWASVHQGYFSDTAAARPYLAEVEAAVFESNPAVLVDLGGGTGLILDALIQRGLDSAIRVVNMDLSPVQLQEVPDQRIDSVQVSADAFLRSAIDRDDKRFLLIARSLLHYMGNEGLMPFLSHLRAQMRTGEYFVHQSACFESPHDAERLNRLYTLMGTTKRFYSNDVIKTRLDQAGLFVKSAHPAPPLLFASEELMERYGISKAEMIGICGQLAEEFGETPGVFELTPNGFHAQLHYFIYTCVAVR